MMKYLFSLVATLLFSCGVAFAASDAHILVVDRYDKCLVLCDDAAAMVAQVPAIGPQIELPDPSTYSSPTVRSDMQAASAGYVFKGTVDQLQTESTAPS
jgi:hypothetical protein